MPNVVMEEGSGYAVSMPCKRYHKAHYNMANGRRKDQDGLGCCEEGGRGGAS